MDDEGGGTLNGGVAERFSFRTSIRFLIAKIGGYFWLPCPICGRMFGGFEIAPRGLIDRMEGGVTIGRAVCKKCGSRAQIMNLTRFWKYF